MAEENEKKSEAILLKKATHTVEAKNAPNTETSQKKKKVVVVKKKQPAQEKKKTGEGLRPVVKKHSETPSIVFSDQKELPKKENVAKDTTRKSVFTFEINTTRPNIKAGNLSDSPSRRNYGKRTDSANNGANRNSNNYGQNEGRTNTNSGQNFNRNNTQGGFTGAQARQGYQNRERDGRNGFQNSNGGGRNYRNGSGRQGYGNGQGGAQNGGFNRGNAQGGFNGGRARQGYGNNNQGGFSGGFNPPDSMVTNKTPQKKAFKGKKIVYNRKDKEEIFDEDKFFESKKKAETPISVVPPRIDIMETVSISDLARKMNLKASEIIGKLMSMGMMATINQSIDSDTATLLASEYNCEVHIVSLYDETVIESDKSNNQNELPRPPIVTVMGHVDHGKTKTLDAIRHSHVAEGEAGGITQSIGAYSVTTPKGKITFLDTPGHEAFTMMRARGAQITDIVVLVVAADDGVMPQTLEAINHAKDAKVPIIVAVNKVDKPDANPDRVKTQLTELGLTPEDWGGETQYVHISALKGEGIDNLLDAILLQAEMLELKTVYDCRAEGRILESRVDQGRGVVSTVIVQRGTLHQGDPFVAGVYSGRVRALFNDRGQRIEEAEPSLPVEVLGIEDMPNAGDPFQVTETEKEARLFSVKRQELKRFEDAKAVKKVTLENLYSTIEQNEIKEFKVIIKADLQGSAEALKQSLEKLSTSEIRLVVIHSSAGAINESDVTLAAADSNAIIIGFNVRPTPKAKLLAETEKVEIRKYNIIYKCVEEIQQAMEGMLKPDTKEQTIGTLEVRNTFKVPKVGIIAGCYVTDGLIKRASGVNIIRDGIVIWTGKVSSLRRFKDDAKEVAKGFECGVGLADYQDIRVGDQIEAFEYVEVARKLDDAIAQQKQKELEEKKLEVESAQNSNTDEGLEE